MVSVRLTHRCLQQCDLAFGLAALLLQLREVLGALRQLRLQAGNVLLECLQLGPQLQEVLGGLVLQRWK